MTKQRLSSPVWREHVAQWRADGTSMQSYANQHALPAARFNYWIKRRDREAHMAQLVPVRMQQPVSTADWRCTARPDGRCALMPVLSRRGWRPCCQGCGEPSVLFGMAGHRAG